jgi:hypothetical protein
MLEPSSECLPRNGLVGILDVRYVWRKQRAEYHEECASTRSLSDISLHALARDL